MPLQTLCPLLQTKSSNITWLHSSNQMCKVSRKIETSNMKTSIWPESKSMSHQHGMPILSIKCMCRQIIVNSPHNDAHTRNMLMDILSRYDGIISNVEILYFTAYRLSVNPDLIILSDRFKLICECCICTRTQRRRTTFTIHLVD